MEDNLTAVLYGINDLRLEQRKIPEIRDDQVLLRMDVVGICGSDVHYYTKGCIGHFILDKPMVIGHEGAGTVHKIGKNVKHLAIGDRCAIEPGECCRQCTHCKSGRYNLCANMQFCATPPYDGNLTRYYAHAADFCYKLPENVSLEEGALIEPLSVAVHACNRAKVRPGDLVLVMGAGPIGLMAMLAAKAYGASKVIITDILEKRLEIARELGADDVLMVTSDDNEDIIVKKLIEKFNGQPNISMECSGAEQSARCALRVTKSGGTAVLIGMGKSEMTLPLQDALIREVDIKGIFRYANCYATAIELVAARKIDVKPLITHRFRLDETIEAFRATMTPSMHAIKVLICVNK